MVDLSFEFDLKVEYRAVASPNNMLAGLQHYLLQGFRIAKHMDRMTVLHLSVEANSSTLRVIKRLAAKNFTTLVALGHRTAGILCLAGCITDSNIRTVRTLWPY